ncbi:ubiquinol-cytochrome c reductase iron-sulfur subunit [Thermodesulfobacteriota bacterium]
MERRAFLKTGFLKIAGFITATLLAFPVISFIGHRKIRTRTITFGPDEQNSAVYYKDGVYLINSGSEIFALSARCTHLGCTLNYDLISKNFKCPCHGSIFDDSGKYLSGPAKKDLTRVPFSRKKDGGITVTLDL